MVTTNYLLQVDWENDGNYTGTYDDVSSETFNVQFRRGRDYASQVSGNSTAGKLTAYLNNEAEGGSFPYTFPFEFALREGGKYSPSNAASVLAGNLEVGRPVRFGTAKTGEFPYEFPMDFSKLPVPEWTGRLQSLVPEPSSTGLNRVVLTAVGPLGYINDLIPISEMQSDIRTDEAIGVILDDAGWGATERELAVGQTTMNRWWTDSVDTITALRIVEETENGFVKETATGAIAFESRNTRLSEPYITSQALFSDSGVGGEFPYTFPFVFTANSYMQLEQTDPLETVINRFDATFRSYLVTGQPDLWTYPETGVDSPQLAAGERRSFIAEYPNNSSDPEAIGVDAWLSPVSGVDIIANSAANGAGIDASSSMVIQQNPRANQMLIIVENNYVNATTGKPSTVWLQTLKARGTPIKLKDNTLVTQSDSASVTKYGERKFTADTPFFPYLATAQSWCNYQIQMYSTPINVMTMTFNANSNQGNMNAAIDLDVSDRITLDATGNAELGVSGDFFIEEINHSITNGGQLHMVTWKLSPADSGYTQFWKLDTGALGSTTVPAY
mgnify:CR=1 FL=1|jgi:hypothetical protein|tara:strand:- start:1506 stop:3179 length:1674 start_codon:yes stop_codon:yes gene_type:complete